MIFSQSAPSKPHSPRQHGGVVVEFALIITVLISILAGVFEFGRAFWYYDALSKATRDGARLMSVSDKASILSLGVPGTKKAVFDAVTSAGVPNFAESNVEVTCLDATFTDSVCTDGTAPGGVRIRIVDYTMSIGQYIPFLIGATTSYATALAPHTTMRYML